LFRIAVRSVMRGVINEENSDINLVNGLSIAWIFGSGMFLESVTEAYKALGRKGRVWG
jgi:hypothetical protein